jgi:SAM-dependent methyltransferase
MSFDRFCCPLCKEVLTVTVTALSCASCRKKFPIVGGVPDFFISETQEDSVDEANQTWLDPRIVEARDTVYRLCARELKGMAFCMQEISRRTGEKCRVLEVGMGTGHFTQWLVEVTKPGTEIYAFDFSWPIIEKAKKNTQGLSNVTLFRANARGLLPFSKESFDILFLRLAPLGAHGIPNVQAGYELLRPGGWYFSAGWEQVRYETSPTEWAMRHGYESAEHHEWQYWRTQTEQERAASQIESECLESRGCQTVKTQLQTRKVKRDSSAEGTIQKMTREHLLIARKPASR